MATKKKDAPAKKPNHIDNILEKMKKEFKDASVRTLADRRNEVKREVIPTGIEVIDNWVFGCGGLPAWTVGELFGTESSGKTSIGFTFMAAAQKAGGVAVLYETENTLKEERAAVFGCNLDELIIAEPVSADDVVSQIKSLLTYIPDGTGPNVIVWDSLAAAPSKVSVEGGKGIGNRSRLMSEHLPVITKELLKKRTALVVINQIREKIGVTFGDKTTTPGGNTLKFMTSWRLQLWKGSEVKSGTDVIGQYTTVKCVKNKEASPQKKARVKLDYKTGWDNEWSTIDLAKERGLIPKGSRQGKKTYDAAIKELLKEEDWHK